MQVTFYTLTRLSTVKRKHLSTQLLYSTFTIISSMLLARNKYPVSVY